MTSAEAIAAADRDQKVIDERQEHPDLSPSASMNDGHWEVAYFAEDKELVLVLVDSHDGKVMESWTGYQVAWKMARGYSGQFGHKLNAPYVFLPLCAIFLIGLVDWRRWRRVANLDLLVLLAFGVSHVFFNLGEIGVSVPLQYGPLLYLLARALWIGFRGRGEGLRPVWPALWLLVAALFLMGFRVGLNMADSGAVDVGYAGVVGADRIVHGEAIYGNFPDDISEGDTYGPVNYYAYVPFELIWPWTGTWNDIPAAHGAAITFDIATFALLILLGFRIRPGPGGRRLAAILAFGWAAYPYTAFTLESNSNDSLVAMLLVGTLVILARPLARGALLALATFAKFVPAVLAPMLLTYETKRRSALLFVAGFALAGVAVMLWPAIDPGLKTFYDRTIGFQQDRDSPFSIWGQVNGIEWLRLALTAATAALSLLLAFRPRRKSLLQVAALGAALIIAVQLTLQHWFYLYLVWFYPLLLVALALLGDREDAKTPAPEPGPSPARSNQPAPVG
ncbi:MAG TPA: glycosyltransferase 87 family protein [Solirubrobacterales bacterium]|nr:glycosyltransferase 87 family protein [Solirubrobacterales bacterium]